MNNRLLTLASMVTIAMGAAACQSTDSNAGIDQNSPSYGAGAYGDQNTGRAGSANGNFGGQGQTTGGFNNGTGNGTAGTGGTSGNFSGNNGTSGSGSTSGVGSGGLGSGGIGSGGVSGGFGNGASGSGGTGSGTGTSGGTSGGTAGGMGGSGGILTASHAVGPEFRRMADDPSSRQEIHESLLAVFDALAITPAATSCKAALNLMGLPGGHVRLPYVDADDSETATIRAMLEERGLVGVAAS